MPCLDSLPKTSQNLPPEEMKIPAEDFRRVLEDFKTSEIFAAERKREEMKRKDIPPRARISTARLWISSPHLLGKG
ncbi:hypothetical protein [Ponticoccus alexandrii]|uniref:Uncharacterized protein n=1 Tax=Ponticoccus alexandrii TaxID=1943633 RepID=A0ABX7F768_9RHOB|nr:hypothetical protein [Ponticoccus alexandrii]QRF66366.1 hypothetical protein GQA70_08620 [Ponticoccus alexandrii]